LFTYKSFLLLIAFVCGAVVMGVELVGSRVLAPFFGSSIFVWGSLISVFMGALSLGYYSGGWFSDKSPDLFKLAGIIFLAALFILTVPLTGKPVNNFISDLNFDVRWSTLFASTILFFLPVALLGVVSPYIIKMSTSKLENIGVRAGSVYAVSTLGSIAGTLLTSFYLISVIGVSAIFYCFGLLLILLAGVMVLTGAFALTPKSPLSEREETLIH
jgi:predicted membrane-bound spermidine synthase